MSNRFFVNNKNETVFKGEIRSLTSARFFAAFYVVIYHIHYFSKIDLGVANTFLSSGYLAVDFFFVLSGFILSHTYYSEITTGVFSKKDFIIKRIARIYPVHFITLILAVLMLWGAYFFNIELYPKALDVSSFVQNLLMVHAWGGSEGLSYNQPSWSISAEFFAYLLFPLLFGVLYKKNPFLILSFFVLFMLTLYFLLLYHVGYKFTQYHPSVPLLRIALEFTFGIVLNLFFRRYRFNGNIKSGLFVTFALLVFCFCYGDLDIFSVLLSGGLIYFLSDLERQKGEIWLNHRIWMYWGRVSYSLYMIHYCVLFVFMYLLFQNYIGLSWGAGNVSAFGVLAIFLSLILCFPCAMALYHFVEVPARRAILRRFVAAK